MICDDAYAGLVYDDRVPRRSPYWDLVGRHPDLVPVKIDGATKELSFFGGRVGFLTFPFEPGSPAAAALDSKVKFLLRATVGSPVAPSQVLVAQALGSADLDAEIEAVRRSSPAASKCCARRSPPAIRRCWRRCRSTPAASRWSSWRGGGRLDRRPGGAAPPPARPPRHGPGVDPAALRAHRPLLGRRRRPAGAGAPARARRRGGGGRRGGLSGGAARARRGLYLHVPFCSAVCPYCDFAVTVGGERSHQRYLDALLAEIGLWAAADGARGAAHRRCVATRLTAAFDTVYFGGGTPSALAPAALEAIVAALAERLGTAGAWTHFEANPEDVTDAAAALWRRLGVSVLSLGVQSFSPPPSPSSAAATIRSAPGPRVAAARRAAIPVVSLDLIYGLPGQSEADWRRDLEAAVALAPEHLSCYQLTVEPRTVFGHRRSRGELHELPEPRQAALFRFTHRFLADAGYAAYEVSNFAREPRWRSRHNRKYWDHTPYLGLGPSAHSFDGRRRRWWNHRGLAAWRAAVERGERPVAAREELDRETLALERLMLALRTVDGLDLARFREALRRRPRRRQPAAPRRPAGGGPRHPRRRPPVPQPRRPRRRRRPGGALRAAVGVP